MRIELLHVPGCEHLQSARRLLVATLSEIGLDIPIEQREGAYPSPTILVDGEDVMGPPASSDAACRLDVPTREKLFDALRKAAK